MQNHTLRDGKSIPPIGLGTYGLKGSEGEVVIGEAIRAGYRLIDTAVRYENEETVGNAVNRSGVDREELFVATKVPGADHGFDAAIESVRGSLERMKLDYLDLVLIHWPNPSQNKYVDTWRGLISARDEGLVKSIGVSNFLPEHLDRLIEETGETPVVNQVELNPYFQQETLRDYNYQKAILTECWAPLGRKTDLLQSQTLADIAKETGKTIAQVILRWEVQNNLLPIPKSSNIDRQRANLEVFDWELSDDHMEQIRMLNTGNSGFGFDPRDHEEF